MSVIVGVDIGGTFTDVVCVDEEKGEIYLTKTITNHQDIIGSVIAGARKILGLMDATPGAIERIVIGTTVATNVVVQRAGAKTSVFTTKGFEDVLEIGRLKRRDMYDMNIDVQTPVFLCPKRYRVGVPERLDAAGNVIEPLDEASVARAITEMREEHDIESIAVVYLFSFENNAHELRTREIIKERYPDMFISLSCEVNPIFREYERTVVTAFDAYMRPKMERAMGDLERQLRDFGIKGEIHVMQSHGGVTTARNAGHRPVNLFLSGPAGGVVGAAQVAVEAGCPNSVTIDTGGTSCDVAVVDEGVPTIRGSGEIAGYPVRVPMVDINTIGAGGGSLLRVDGAGMLHVGPESAGSDPGPVCYRKGGTEATITDASLTAGYLNPVGFAGGELDLDVEGATKALEGIGKQLGMSAVEAALGAHRIMNVQMAEQVRLITLKRGYDPRQFTLMAFGGAGPLHAGALVSMLDMKGCLIPPAPGVLSAFGLLNGDIEAEVAESFLHSLQDVDMADLKRALKKIRQRGIEIMRDDGIDPSELHVRYGADLRYTNQSYEIAVPLRSEEIDEATLPHLAADFQAMYLKMYGHTNRTPIEVVNLRVVTYKPVQVRGGLRIRQLEGVEQAPESEKEVWFLGADRPLRTRTYRRERMSAGSKVEGPAIIEQADTTVLVYPDQAALVDASNNLRIGGVSKAYSL